MKTVPKFTIPKEFRNLGSGSVNTASVPAKKTKKPGEEGDKKENAYCSRCHVLFGK